MTTSASGDNPSPEGTEPRGAADEADLARHFNLYDTTLDADPWPTLRQLQSKCPVAFSQEAGGYWAVTSYEGVREVLAQPDRFSSRWTAVPAPENPMTLIPLTLDPPEHTKYRQFFTPLFSPGRMRTFEPAAVELARTHAEAFVQAGGGDFVEAFAVPFPGLMFLRTFGLPEQDFAQLSAWKEVFLRELVSDNEELRAHAANEVLPRIIGYFSGLIADRRAMADPPDDILTPIVRMEVEGRPLTDDEIANVLILFMTAGLDTVTNTLALSFAILAERPDLREQIISNPAIIPSATEELLRYTSIVTSCRVAVVDSVVAGVRIPAGDWVANFLPIASRDPAEFEDPHTIDFSREHNRHLAFGTGPHRCLGSHLARLEIAAALRVVHEVMPDYSVREGTTPGRHFGSIMGCRELLLTVGRRGGSNQDQG